MPFKTSESYFRQCDEVIMVCGFEKIKKILKIIQKNEFFSTPPDYITPPRLKPYFF
jgi:hypothetical protein